MTDSLEHATAENYETPSLFEPGDPRAGPFTPAEIEEARRYAAEPGRWHKNNPSLDWYAVRLQYGRGMSVAETARLFGLPQRRVYTRHQRDDWAAMMAERDRRWLARLVWLAGEARLSPDDETGRRMLARASEWRPFIRPKPARWRPLDPRGELPRFDLALAEDE